MASLSRKLRAKALTLLFRTHAFVYESSGGIVGTSERWPTLLLTTTGRKSGKPRTTPLVYFEHEGSFVVVGSDGAARRHPQWFRNLEVDPRARIRVGRAVHRVHARTAVGEERDRLVARGRGVNPMWERYQSKTSRELPYVVLEPVRPVG